MQLYWLNQIRSHLELDICSWGSSSLLSTMYQTCFIFLNLHYWWVAFAFIFLTSQQQDGCCASSLRMHFIQDRDTIREEGWWWPCQESRNFPQKNPAYLSLAITGSHDHLNWKEFQGSEHFSWTFFCLDKVPVLSVGKNPCNGSWVVSYQCLQIIIFVTPSFLL